MSLILEALRKSEAERRRGEVPGLYSDRPAPAPTPRRQPWPWLLAALAVAIAISAWWRPREADYAPPPAPALAPVVAPPDLATPDAAPPIVANTARPPTPAKSAPTAAPSPSRMPIAKTAQPVIPAIEPAHTEPAHTDPHDTGLQSGDLQGGDLQLGDLEPAERADLPPLRLSMHVWNRDPAQRFAIVDGQRVGEGDRIGEAVVESIDLDGLHLAWRGLRLRLPRP